MARPKAQGQSIMTQRIKALMQEQGITQVALAETVGVAPQTILRWANGHTNPSNDDLKRLSQALGTTTDYLRGYTFLKTEEDLLREYEEGGLLDDTPDGALEDNVHERRRTAKTLNCFLKMFCGYSYAERITGASEFGGEGPHILKDQTGNEYLFSDAELQEVLKQMQSIVDMACFRKGQRGK